MITVVVHVQKIFISTKERYMNMDTIINTIFFTVLFIACTAEGVRQFNKIFPIRYGKNYVELKGIIVGEQDMKVGAYGRIVKIPVVQFIWEGKTHEIADRTSHIHRDYKIGDEVTVCYNPTKDENDAIIKRGKFAIETFWPWFFFFIIAIGCFVCMILGILILMKVIE